MSRRWLLVSAIALVACRGFLGIDELPAEQADSGVEAEAAPVVDAGSEEEAAPPTFCDKLLPPADYCSDFDKGALFDQWNNKNTVPDIGESGGGSIVGDTTTNFEKSPPRSARLHVPALLDNSFAASAFVQKTLGAQTDLTIQLDLRVDLEYFVPDAGAHIIPLVFVTYGPSSLLILVGRDATATYLFVGDLTPIKLTTPIIQNKWTTVTLVIQNRPLDDAGPGPGLVKVEVDTLIAASSPIPVEFQQLEQLLNVGPIITGPVGEFQMTIDDVRIWTRTDL